MQKNALTMKLQTAPTSKTRPCAEAGPGVEPTTNIVIQMALPATVVDAHNVNAESLLKYFNSSINGRHTTIIPAYP